MTEKIAILISLATLGSIIFTIFRYLRKPNEDINLINQRCQFKHKAIDLDFHDIKENHLKHIERDINEIKISLTKIKTILEERFKK